MSVIEPIVGVLTQAARLIGVSPRATSPQTCHRASSIHQMKSDTRGPSNSRLNRVKVGLRTVVHIARRLTLLDAEKYGATGRGVSERN